jgi:hypothetical protein
MTIIKIHNIATGEIIEREMNEAELSQREADAVIFAEQEALRQAEAEAKAEAKTSALAKLEALGLTADEIAAIN